MGRGGAKKRFSGTGRWGAGAALAALSALAMFVLAVLLIWCSIPGGWFIALTVLLALGINLVALGVVGEYIGKIYLEVKQRPRFIVEKTLGDSK